MGIILSRFRTKPSTKELLGKIEQEITSIEEFKLSTQQQQRKIVFWFGSISVVLFVVLSAGVYFYFPQKIQERILCVVVVLVFPFLMWMLLRFFKWYYSRRIRKNEQKLTDLQAKKKKILDEVMETETFKTAKEILEKYAPEQLQRTVAKSPTSTNKTLMSVRPSASPVRGTQSTTTGVGMFTSGLRQRSIGQTRTSSTASSSGIQSSYHSAQPRYAPSVLSQTQRYSSLQQTATSTADAHPRSPVTLTNGRGTHTQTSTNLPMPRPVLPRERGYMDRFVEYLVGDGPANRYALICKECESHNGMALRDEFEYLSFRCCYCHYWNPARKQRPQAPRLPEPVADNSTSSSENEESIKEPKSVRGKSAEMQSPSTSSDTTTANQEDIQNNTDKETSQVALGLKTTENQQVKEEMLPNTEELPVPEAVKQELQDTGSEADESAGSSAEQSQMDVDVTVNSEPPEP